MPSPTPPASAILRRAAELIAEPGAWWHGPGTGKHCASTAVTRAVACAGADKLALVPAGAGNAEWCRAQRELAAQTGERFATYEPLLAIYRWNDAPGRTHAEVLAALYAAAERCEREENP